MVWLDIEMVKFWGTNKATNRAFVKEMLDACAKLNVNVGICKLYVLYLYILYNLVNTFLTCLYH